MNEELKVPEGWEWVNIENDVVVISGMRPKGGAIDDGVPSLGGEHITSDGRVIFSEDNAKFIPEKFYKLMKKGKVEKNDILINKDGANTGKVAILREKFNPEIAINEHLFIVRSKSLFEQGFLFYWFFSSFGTRQLKEKITGSAQPGLTSNFIKTFLFCAPLFQNNKKSPKSLKL